MIIPLMPQNKLLKIVFIVLAIVPVFIFLPFVLGGGLIYLLYKKMPANGVRNALLIIVGALTLFVGSAWTMGVFNPPLPTKKDAKQEPVVITNPKPPETSLSAQAEVKAASTEAKLITGPYPVAKVIDGDTVSVDINGKQEVIRVIGLDSPETVDPRKPVQCFGKEASDKAKQILVGKKVSLEPDPPQGDKDKYNRLLRYLFLENGTNFSQLMISEGYAHEYTYNLPYKYQLEFKAAEKLARENKKGLWADDACPITPTQTTPMVPQPVPTAPTPTQQGNYTCSGKTICGQMTSCAEANFYLNNCGVSRLDGDKDGVPCETLCN